MRKTIRTLSLMMVVLFALSILPGGKGLSSANAYDDPCPEKAKMKFTWSVPNYGPLYTNEIFLPYTPDSGAPYYPTNPAGGFVPDLRDYDYGVKVANWWEPTYYAFSFPIPFPPYSYTTWVPYYFSPWFATPGVNFAYMKLVDQAYTFYPTPPKEQYPFINDGWVSDLGKVTLTTMTLSTVPCSEGNVFHVGDFVELMGTVIGGPNAMTTTTLWGDPFISSDGGDPVTSYSYVGPSLSGGAPFTCLAPGTVTVTVTYTYDMYSSGWWNWEETIRYDAYPIPRQSMSESLVIKFIAAP